MVCVWYMACGNMWVCICGEWCVCVYVVYGVGEDACACSERCMWCILCVYVYVVNGVCGVCILRVL